jgi:hypothetical protein
MEDNISKEEQWAKMNIERRIVLKNHITTAAQVKGQQN